MNISWKYQNKKSISLVLLKNIKNNVDYLTGFVTKLLLIQFIIQQTLHKKLIWVKWKIMTQRNMNNF
jgi:hypothetical protein